MDRIEIFPPPPIILEILCNPGSGQMPPFYEAQMKQITLIPQIPQIFNLWNPFICVNLRFRHLRTAMRNRHSPAFQCGDMLGAGGCVQGIICKGNFITVSNSTIIDKSAYVIDLVSFYPEHFQVCQTMQ
jgi:hypothetical protein